MELLQVPSWSASKYPIPVWAQWRPASVCCELFYFQIRWTVDLKCDVVNYSFGEHCVWPNMGRVCKHLNELVNAYGVVMVASGGNNGPGLGTVGCPGGVVEGLIGVAPLVFPEMMRSLYGQPDHWSLVGVDTEQQNYDTMVLEPSIPSSDTQTLKPDSPLPAAYTWGSRGPTLDGSLGLCVAAPGAAYTSVAGWQLRPSALLNGSSMSSPLVAGGVALLISAVRHVYSLRNCVPPRIPPSLIRLALMNTALPVQHLSLFDQGHGLLQVDKAFDYIIKTLRITSAAGFNSTLESISATDHFFCSRNGRESSPEGTFISSSGIKKLPDCSITNQLLSSPTLVQPSTEYGWRLRCAVTGPGCSGPQRGIWLRRGWIPKLRTYPTFARPTWLPILRYNLHIGLDFDQSVPLDFRRRLDLHLSLTVTCHSGALDKSVPDSSTQPSQCPAWLQVASTVSVTSLGRDVSLAIDPNRYGSNPNKIPGLQAPTGEQLLNRNITSHEGTVGSWSWPSSMALPSSTVFPSCEPHLTTVNISDPGRPHLGILAQVPITVHLPIHVPPTRGIELPRLAIREHFDLSHKVRRWFIDVPAGATVGVLRLARLDENDSACEFKVSVQFPRPRSGLTVSDQEVTWPLLTLNRCGFIGTTLGRQRGVSGRRVGDDFDGATQLAFPISWEADYMELTIAQHWGLEAPAVIFGELYFRGLELSPRQVSLSTSDHYTRVVLRSNFTTEDVAPHISLTHWVLPLRPCDSKILYLGHGQNEVLLTQRGCYALRLTYRFSCPFKYSLTHFELPWLHELLYESDYLVQLYHIYDCRGRFLGAGDFDVKRPKRPKFALSLDKGDYKVVVQICHETGPNLNGTTPKNPADAVGNVTRTSGHARSGGPTGGGAVTTNSPLERLRQHCAVVRFRLPGPNTVGPSDSVNERQPTGSGSNVPVTFEFAAFPFSLGLNGVKPCSALDPLPYGCVDRMVADGTVRLNDTLGTENPAEQETAVEINRRCPCLPTSLCANESTSVYIGLCDQRYPTYAIAGSYFAGTIGFYNSDLLQNVVTYPFRLIIDSLPVTDNSTKPSAATESEQTGHLVVGSLGLSEEDFLWLLPLNRLLLSEPYKPTVDNNLTQNAENITEQPTDQETAVVPFTPDMSQVWSLHNGIEHETKNFDTSRDSLLSEDQTVVENSRKRCTSERQVDQHCNNGVDEEHLINDVTVLLPRPLTPNSCPSDPTDSPASARPRRLMKIHSESSLIKNLPMRSLSSQLATIHEQLILLDAPLRSRDKVLPLRAIRAQRSSIWAQCDLLIVGRVLDHRKDIQNASAEESDRTLPKQSFLHHLLTMRLVSSQTSNKSAGTGQSKSVVQPNSIGDDSAAATVPTLNVEHDIEQNGALSESTGSAQQLISNTPERKSLDESMLPNDVSPSQSQKSKRDGAVAFTYMELKLRLIDTLARYGRLLCERILFEIADADASNTSKVTTLHCEPRTSGPPQLLTNPLTCSETSCHTDQFDESLQTVRKIYTRLNQLITVTVSGINSIMDSVRVGSHALPTWLLASGMRDLHTCSVEDTKAFLTSRTLGSVGGRVLLFCFLYALVERHYAHALRLLTRIVYQLEEPPTTALSGLVTVTNVPSMGPLRPVMVSTSGSLATAKQAHTWLLWMLDHFGWKELALHLKQQAPILFAERDYSLMAD
ncbi:Tripeptidyl-peptidase II [Paragonimus heterotremus]|uniref:Tripeptidyl-peptidase II n=1 Tax=Paragonimus heterotremus TaxID=100268 RepID=A0A8J4TG68_9TREM|nr:Tripeptidyl-peptidase II [Paragonimus heterotremus]